MSPVSQNITMLFFHTQLAELKIIICETANYGNDFVNKEKSDFPEYVLYDFDQFRRDKRFLNKFPYSLRLFPANHFR